MGDITAVAPRVGEISLQKTAVQTKIEPRIGDIAVTVPKLEPKLDIPPQNIPDYRPPPGETLPRLPPLPPIGLGTRDLPVTRSFKMYSRKLWEETWFGDIGLGSGRKTKTRSSRKTSKTKTRKRGGRK